VPAATPIVHIGYPKTATTWFQKSFYPHVRNRHYVDRKRVNAAFLHTNALAFDPAEARAQLGFGDVAADSIGSAILCEEGLSGYLHNGGVAGFVSKGVAEALRATLPDARIIIFIRAQPTMIVASYQQYIRSGGTYGPHRYVFPNDFLGGAEAVAYKQPRFDLDHFLYSRLIGLYEALFGRDNVHVFLFEEFQQRGLDFLHDIAVELGLDPDWDEVSLQRRLASYGLSLTWIARLLNLFTAHSVLDKHHLVDVPGWHRPRRALLEALNRTALFGKPPTPKRLLGKDTLRRVERHFAEDNRRLAERRNLSLELFGYPLAPTLAAPNAD
jgi:hypothetical protein